GGVRKIDYRFFKIDSDNGQTVATKMLATANPITVIRDQIMFKEKLLLFGHTSWGSVIIKIDKNLNLVESFKIELPERESSPYIYRASAVTENKISFLGGNFGGANGTNIFLGECDIEALSNISKIAVSNTPFSQTYAGIERSVGGKVVFHFGSKCFKLGSENNHQWTKEIRLDSNNKALLPIDLQDEIYSVFGNTSSSGGHYVIAKTKEDYESCETDELTDTINFENYSVTVQEQAAQIDPFTPVSYADPAIQIQALSTNEIVFVCESSGGNEVKPSLKYSTIVAKPDCIIPDGQMQSIISVRLFDEDGSPYLTGDVEVELVTSFGQLGTLVNHNNGLYTTTLTGTTNGLATLGFKINGQEAGATTQVSISKKCKNTNPSPRLSTISAKPLCIAPGGRNRSYITVQLYDEAGNIITTGGHDIAILTSLGNLSNVIDNENGTYSAQLASNVEGNALLTFTVNGVLAVNTVTVQISKRCGEDKADPNASTISASPTCIVPKTKQFSVITVRLFDANGNPILSGNNTVQIQSSNGNLSATTNNQDGTYTATLTSSSLGFAQLTFLVNGVLSDNYVTVLFAKKCDSGGGASTKWSIIKAEPKCILPNKKATATITVYLYDENGNPILFGGNLVEIETSLGIISATTDNNDGSYTAYLTSGASGLAVVTFTINGVDAIHSETVVISKKCGETSVSLKNSQINATPNCVKPDGTSQATILVKLYDSDGDPILIGGDNVLIESTFGTITITNDNGNGTYSALLSSTQAGEATVSFKVDGAESPNKATVIFSEKCGGLGVDLEKSTIVAIPDTITNNGTDSSVATVTLYDTLGNLININSYTVEIIPTFGNISPTSFDPATGTYQAIFTSSAIGIAVLGFTVNGTSAAATDTVKVIKEDPVFTISENTKLQSSNLYLQAAGSTGNDGSVSGVHLRWMLKGDLGNTHLPKGDLAASNHNYNKPDDFVRVYRASYVPQYATLDFQELSPTIVDHNNYLWIYQIDGNPFYVYFKNTIVYDQVKASINPLTSSYSFIQAYGNELIEVDHKTTLSFAVRLKASATSVTVRAEVLSVENNNLTAIKYLAARKVFTGGGRFEEENIRAVRYQANHIKQIQFELYADTLASNTNQGNWSFLGAYALTTEDTIAEDRLEPSDGSAPIDGTWLRFNNNETVNKDNYLDRWNGVETQSYGSAYYENYDRRLKTVVRRYVELADNDAANPTAVEAIPFGNVLPDGVTDQAQDVQEISNLYLIQLASMDYHLARMLGLGHIDRDNSVNDEQAKFIYLAEYVTIEGSNAEQQHLYLSLPTGKSDERLPLPVTLQEPILGTNNQEGNLSNLIDEQGYLYDGKQRFISLVNEPLLDNLTNVAFFVDSTPFSTSESTTPVYAGLEYKLFNPANPNASDWKKPELSNTSKYRNYVASGSPTFLNNETIPILIPDPNETLFFHREREEGWHRYSSYGINWFSRSQRSTVFWDVETKFKPQNRLLPPSNVKACLIVKENPLMFTSAREQVLYDDLVDANASDKTLVRLTFDHHIDQDKITYQINEDSMGAFYDPSNPDAALNANAIFKDDREVFADKINLFFRNRPPKTVAGKIKSIVAHPNNTLAIVRTEGYLLPSTGEVIMPEIASNELSHFIGSVFMFDTVKYIVQEVASSSVMGEGPIFTIYKEAISQAIINGTDPDPTIPLSLPLLTGITMFNTVENMLTESNWQVGTSTTTNKLGFQISVEDNNWAIYRDTKVHREIIEEESISGVPEQILEKSRGIWKTATIEEAPKPQAKSPIAYDANGNIETEMVHVGMYKITFPDALPHHPQYLSHQVDWHQGIVRIHTQNNPDKKRKILEVVKIENVGETTPLVIYAIDAQFPTNDPDSSQVAAFDPILIGNQEVNFYPGYRVYLYHDAAHHLTENAILPDTGEGVRYSILGLQTVDPDHPEDTVNPNDWYKSKIGQPAQFFAQEIIRPETPLMSNGEEFLYATRPDTFGKSTFTLTPGFSHIPHGIQFYRANDDAILNALYKPETVLGIKERLREDLDPKFHLVKRWQNLLSFDYTYTATFQTDNEFFLYPEDENGYRFPNPDKYQLYQSINDILAYRNDNYPGINEPLLNLGDPADENDNGIIGSLSLTEVVIPALVLDGREYNDAFTFKDYIKSVIFNIFTPLTEIPMVYDHINDHNYQPIAKKQIIRD
ncbi:MAG: Ig-like domain-containing protein, partial [Saprospiraceae bacterium]